jgi:hypothetical protein
MILARKNGRVTGGRWRRERSTEREPRVRGGKAPHDSIRHRGVDVEHGSSSRDGDGRSPFLQTNVWWFVCSVAKGERRRGPVPYLTRMRGCTVHRVLAWVEKERRPRTGGEGRCRCVLAVLQ